MLQSHTAQYVQWYEFTRNISPSEETPCWLISLTLEMLSACAFVFFFRSNFLGTLFTVYDNGISPHRGRAMRDGSNVRQELAAVHYVSVWCECVCVCCTMLWREFTCTRTCIQPSRVLCCHWMSNTAWRTKIKFQKLFIPLEKAICLKNKLSNFIINLWLSCTKYIHIVPNNRVRCKL